MQQRVHGDGDGVKDLATDQVEFDAEHPHIKIAASNDGVTADALAWDDEVDLVGRGELVFGFEQDGVLTNFKALCFNGLAMNAHDDALGAFEAWLTIPGSDGR